MRPVTSTIVLAVLALLAGLAAGPGAQAEPLIGPTDPAKLVGEPSISAKPSAEPNSRAEAPAGDVIDVSDFRSVRDDTAAIEAAIAQASKGDTVYFPAGEYVLDRPFRFASGVNFVGDDGATLRSARPDGLTLERRAAAPLRDVTIRGLTFDNISVALIGSPQYRSFADITFHDCVFTNGHESPDWSDAYLRFTYTSGVTVDSCQFLRSAGHGGRGVIARRTDLTVIKDSYFGTTPDLEHGVPYGHFRTAINVSGYDLGRGDGNRDTVIDGNVWRRTPGLDVSTCDSCQDHGLYAWGTRRLFIVGNRADGWDTTAAGGAVKIRNQDETFVLGNTLSTSGILTYVYDSAGMPNRLNRVVIRDNTINLDRAAVCEGAYCGISFWRNFTGDGQSERSVYITENTFTAGGSIRISQGNGPGFCVQDNRDASLNLLSKGVRLLGCDRPRGWDQPLAGIHRGDFNGDGTDDFVHFVKRDGRDGYWRAHISTGAGFQTANWGNGAYTSPTTADYGVQVADFDGDGLDDLTYSGYCSDRKACWRVYLSTGTSFEPGADWGHDVYASAETPERGFATGDFDGDGRADLVSRAYCGSKVPCWRVHFSTGSRFDARDAGDGARWAQGSVTSDMLVGDYDGDGHDDVAYLGVCDPASTPCVRVHLASGQRLRPENWGGGMYFARTVSPHFGLRVGDVNGDGRDDLGYVGRCGTDATVQWRYHVSVGEAFAVQCSTKNKL